MSTAARPPTCCSHSQLSTSPLESFRICRMAAEALGLGLLALLFRPCPSSCAPHCCLVVSNIKYLCKGTYHSAQSLPMSHYLPSCRHYVVLDSWQVMVSVEA